LVVTRALFCRTAVALARRSGSIDLFCKRLYGLSKTT
jgi:hypothetical protein